MLIRLNAQKPSRGRNERASERLVSPHLASLRRKITGDHEGELTTTGVVTDDLMENNRDVRSRVSRQKGRNVRLSPSLSLSRARATDIHESLERHSLSPLRCPLRLMSYKWIPVHVQQIEHLADRR